VTVSTVLIASASTACAAREAVRPTAVLVRLQFIHYVVGAVVIARQRQVLRTHALALGTALAGETHGAPQRVSTRVEVAIGVGIRTTRRAVPEHLSRLDGVPVVVVVVVVVFVCRHTYVYDRNKVERKNNESQIFVSK
jgi:hypothetical protein